MSVGRPTAAITNVKRPARLSVGPARSTNMFTKGRRSVVSASLRKHVAGVLKRSRGCVKSMAVFSRVKDARLDARPPRQDNTSPLALIMGSACRNWRIKLIKLIQKLQKPNATVIKGSGLKNGHCA